ncbi:glucose-1-phosphate cytidylyltransferase [Candidatus Pseudothioglobus sp. Uisw_050_01]|jgi:glucose-1-phosphate cytidylyltransferase|uniref:glucose-1-phosphate cytidylyltransferase n=1 Tax=Candidatus Pseudothioglobus sp. Uisw_050_01 TaxID=3230997 RepID=UPI003A89050C
MKAVILAGGLGTRISEETDNIPKPMIRIGGMPIIWHIMKHYSSYGINDFVICCGYKGYVIKEYFSNYFLHVSDVTFNMKENKIKVHQRRAEPWNVTLVETGGETMTGGRVKRIERYVKDEEAFCLTYGDGLSDVNIRNLLDFHKKNGKLSTLTAVQLPGRFGVLGLNGDMVENFQEKPQNHNSRINGGFFVLSPKVIDLIEDDSTIWEKGPLEALANKGELSAYKHDGFWQPMDTLREMNYLQKLWNENLAPWKTWK